MFALALFMLLVGGTAGLLGMDYSAIPLLKRGVNRVFKQQAPAAPVPAAEPLFRPIARERSIAGEHQVETPDTPADALSVCGRWPICPKAARYTAPTAAGNSSQARGR